MRFPRMQNLCDAPEIPLVTLMRLHHTRRIHTNLHHGVPDTARTRFPTLIEIDTSCSFSLTPEFTDAIDKAEKAANDLRDSLNGSNRRVRRRTT